MQSETVLWWSRSGLFRRLIKAFLARASWRFGHDACTDSGLFFGAGVNGRWLVAGVFVLGVGASSGAESVPELASAVNQGKGLVALGGSGFGPGCAECEVIGDFGGFRYAFPVERWSPGRIVVRAEDLGRGRQLEFEVRVGATASNRLRHRLPERLVPAKRLRRTVTPGTVDGLRLFEHRSNRNVGARGEERYDVSESLPTCGQTGFRFESAELILGPESRFASASIRSQPLAGCVRCTPIDVEWEHEPAGRIHFQVHVYRSVLMGICSDRVRR